MKTFALAAAQFWSQLLFSLAAGAAVTALEFLVTDPAGGEPVSLGIVTAPPWSMEWTVPPEEGARVLSARATDSAGMVSSAVITLHAITDLNALPPLLLLSPQDGDAITAPVEVTGTVEGADLRSYALEFRAVLPDGAGAWRTLTTGNAGITAGPLGTLDPTLLENGPGELRLTAERWDGGRVEGAPVSVLLDGNMKLGHFAVAFEDLSVPMPGLNVTVTRSYDSRRTDGADFGIGWDLAVSSMRVVKNRPLGDSWVLGTAEQPVQLPQGVELALWCARAPLRKLVTIQLPDGTALAFKPRLEVHPGVRLYSPEPDCSVVPQDQVKVVFTPVGKTLGTLEPVDPPVAIAFPQLNDGPYGPGAGQPGVCRLQGGLLSKGMPGLDPAYEPVTFKYTSPEGAVFIVEQTKGVESVTDRNGNRLTFTPQAITHTPGSAGAPPAGGGAPAPTTQIITFTRDAADRITAITDPAGAQLLYTYDAQGRLTHFTDRTGGVTEYRYGNAAFPFYLTEIIDPVGNRAVKSLYDDSGRLIGQEDADGHAVTMVHDVAAYKETVIDRLGHATVHEYDENGNVVKTTDALGGITLRTYDDRDRETSVTDPLGHTIAKTYDARDNILTETNALGETTSYTYNDRNQPLTITDPLGHATTFSYDANGNTTAITDATGRATTFTFDGNGSVTSLTMPGGTRYGFTLDGLTGQKLSQTVTGEDGAIAAHQTFTYDANGELTGTTDYLVPAGAADTAAAVAVRRTEHSYDAAGRMTSMRMVNVATGASFVTQSWTYNANGDELTYTDPLGRVTTSEYDSQGRDFRTTHPDGTTSVLVYDANGDIISTTNRSGGVMTYEMDALGRQIKVVNVDGTISTTAYDAAGREIAKTDALGLTTTMTCDAADRLLTTTDPAGNTTAFAYDAAGRQFAETDPEGRTTTTELDAAGRPLRVVAPDGTSSEFTYDGAGRVTTETDAMGFTTRRDHDAQGRLIKLTNALGGITRMEYDTLGRPQRLIDALGRVTSYTTDAMGRRTSRTLPGGQTETMSWQNALQPASRTDFNGYTTTFTYDAEGNLLEKSADPGHPSLMLPHAPAKVRFTYNQFDLPATAEVLNAAGVVIHSMTWSYDAYGRLVSAAGPEGTLTYSRDPHDRITEAASATAGGFHAAYSYDDAGRLSTLTDHRTGTPQVHSFAWNPAGSLASSTTARGLVHSSQRDAMNRITAWNISSPAGLLDSFAHSYNAAGRRTSVHESGSRDVSYAYDALHRLTQEDIAATGTPSPGSLPVTPGALGYAFDAVGNRLARTSTLTSPAPGAQASTFNDNDELAGLTYDANGNPVAGVATLLPAPLGTGPAAPPVAVATTDVFDFEDRLIRRTRSDGVVVDLVYDANGNRVSKTITRPGQPAVTTRYLIDSHAPNGWPQCVEEHLATGGSAPALQAVYLYGPHGPVTQWTPAGEEQQFLTDAHGSIRGLIDITGQPTAATDYDAYGIPLATGSTTASPLGYNGEYYDPDLGLIYLRARFYDPSTGRFLNRDPYQGMLDDPQSLHAYHFTGNDPVNGVDPSGNFSLLEALHTQVLIRAQKYVQRLQRFEDVGRPAIRTIGSLWVLANMAASWESLLAHAIPGATSTERGSIAQWLKQGFALFRATKYQLQLLKSFRRIMIKDNLAQFGKTLTFFTKTASRVSSNILQSDRWRGRVYQKINGLPEFTPFTTGRHSVFIKGGYDFDDGGQGLTRSSDRDFSLANGTGRTTPQGSTWHHHEVMGIMQLVPSELNNGIGRDAQGIRHEGGIAFWQLMKNLKYDP